MFLLKCIPGSFAVWMGIKCSSWTAINAGTSKRSYCASLGDPTKPSVLDGNMMMERTAGRFQLVLFFLT